LVLFRSIPASSIGVPLWEAAPNPVYPVQLKGHGSHE